MALNWLRVLGLAAAFALVSLPAAADPTGLWLDKDGTTVRVHPCGTALCGTIVSVTPHLDPATGRPRTDKHNPDPAKRTRPLVGVEVFIAMQPAGAAKWSGQLYDSDDGKSYSGNLIELSPDTLKVEGCVFGLCGGEELRRVRQ